MRRKEDGEGEVKEGKNRGVGREGKRRKKEGEVKRGMRRV